MPGDFRHPLDISPAGLGMSLAGHDYGIGIVLSVLNILHTAYRITMCPVTVLNGSPRL